METVRVAVITKENSTIDFPIRACLEEKYNDVAFIHTGIFKIDDYDNGINERHHDFILKNCDLIVYAPDKNDFKERVGFSITLLEEKPVLFAYKRISDGNVNFYTVDNRQAKYGPISSSKDLMYFMVKNGFERENDDADEDDFDDWGDHNHSDEDSFEPETSSEDTLIDLSKVKIDEPESFLMAGVKIHHELQNWLNSFDDDRRRLLL